MLIKQVGYKEFHEINTYQNNSFDIVLLSWDLYLVSDKSSIYEEGMRILKLGGILIASELIPGGDFDTFITDKISVLSVYDNVMERLDEELVTVEFTLSEATEFVCNRLKEEYLWHEKLVLVYNLDKRYSKDDKIVLPLKIVYFKAIK